MTNDFTVYPKNLLNQKPERIKVFRVLLGMGQRKFATYLQTNQSLISLMERGRKTDLPEEKFLDIFSKTAFPCNGITECEYKKIRERGLFQGEYARKMAERSSGSIKAAKAKKATVQEKIIAEYLTSKSIIFEKNGYLNLDGFKVVCDFVIPNVAQPKIVLEAKQLLKKYRKKQIVCELGYKAIKLRKKYPKLKLVAIVDGNLTRSEQWVLKTEFDNYVCSKDLRKIKW